MIKCKQLLSFSLTPSAPPIYLSLPLEPINKHNRPLVLPARPNHIVNQTQNRNSRKHDDSPIKVLSVRRRALGPKAPEESMEGVQNATDVDGDAPSTQGPLAGRKEFGVRDASVKHGADGEDVGYHEGYHIQGDDCPWLARAVEG
jgi:hypothetical protein